MKFFTVLIAAFLGTATMLMAERAQITVFAAASLRGALDMIAQTYGASVHLSYGGSGTMARQIAAGAPADVVILANTEWMDWVEENVDIIPGSRFNLIANQLVLVGPASTLPVPETTDLLSLLGANGRLAMGQRDAVPAGIYAREWLQSTGQWDAVLGRLAETDNVRAALALVARGQAPVGVVYASDAEADPAVRILARIPENTHSAIVYPAAALTTEGLAFLDYLTNAQSQNTFLSHGFSRVTK